MPGGYEVEVDAREEVVMCIYDASCLYRQAGGLCVVGFVLGMEDGLGTCFGYGRVVGL